MEKERIDDLEINGLKIIQNKEYFCFGMDSVLLANFVVSNQSKNVIMDFCSGSGVIPILLTAKQNFSKGICVELQKEMFSLLERNISFNHLEQKLLCQNVDIKETKKIREFLFSHVKREEVDIITCNPPYQKLHTGMKNENPVKHLARHEIACTLEDVFCSASKLLKSKGKLYLVHRPDRLVDLLSIARKYQLEAKRIRFVHPKKEMKASIVLIEYRKDGGKELNVEPPLIEYNEQDDYTEEIYRIYGKEGKQW